MKDNYGRTIEYMRISVTEDCNMHCSYCRPASKGQESCEETGGDIMTDEAILNVVRAAVSCGIDRFKITGGEPLMRPGCPELIGKMKRLEGVSLVTLTTNGLLLEKQLERLVAAGVDAVNVSLDTLIPETYEHLTGIDGLDQVLKGIDAALDAGLKLKINSVLMDKVNDHEWLDLLTLTRDRPVSVRFIEMMPIGHGNRQGLIPGESILSRMNNIFPDIMRDSASKGNGPAIYYKIAGYKGSVGLISAVHGKFCSDCNRIRMTADGRLKPCLSFSDSVDVRAAALDGDLTAIKEAIAQTVKAKPEGHRFDEPESITEKRSMDRIGG